MFCTNFSFVAISNIEWRLSYLKYRRMALWPSPRRMAAKNFSSETSAKGRLPTRWTPYIQCVVCWRIYFYLQLQSTVFGKFSIKPRWGVLTAKEHTHVLVSMSREAELSKKGRDKIVIVCMTAPINEVDYEATASFWRHNICYNPGVEKHQITCLEEDGHELEVVTSKDSPREGSQSVASLRTERKIWR